MIKTLHLVLDPLPNELFSSWVARMSRLYGRTPFNWCSLLSPSGFHCARDLDLILDSALIKDISTMTGIPQRRLREMQLISYEGRLYPVYDKTERSLTQFHISRARVKMLLYGLQCCPQCIGEDQVPYWRKEWRLAFIVGCPKHNCYLLDVCPECHLRFSLSKMRPRQKVTVCGECGYDLLNYDKNHKIKANIQHLQRHFLSILSCGFIEIEPRVTIKSTEFFSLLQRLFKLCSLQQSTIVRYNILEYFIEKGLDLPTYEITKKNYVEKLSTVERTAILVILDYLLKSWPQRFMEMYDDNNLRRIVRLSNPTGYLRSLVDRCDSSKGYWT